MVVLEAAVQYCFNGAAYCAVYVSMVCVCVMCGCVPCRSGDLKTNYAYFQVVFGRWLIDGYPKVGSMFECLVLN